MTEPQNWFHQRSKSVACPVCKATVDERCQEGGKDMIGSHAGRFQARSRQDRLIKQARGAFQGLDLVAASCGESVDYE